MYVDDFISLINTRKGATNFFNISGQWVKVGQNSFILMTGTPDKPLGYSELDFQMCRDQTIAYEKWLAKETSSHIWNTKYQNQAPTGSLESFQRYQDAIQAIKDIVRFKMDTAMLLRRIDPHEKI